MNTTYNLKNKIIINILSGLAALAVIIFPFYAKAAEKSQPTKTAKASPPKSSAGNSAPKSSHLSEEKIKTMYDVFISDWMSKLDKISKTNMEKVAFNSDPDGYAGKYILYGPDKDFWVKKTDSSLTTHVGYLKYKQKVYEKKGKTMTDAQNCAPCLVQENNVTEIFRFTNGKWIY